MDNYGYNDDLTLTEAVRNSFTFNRHVPSDRAISGYLRDTFNWLFQGSEVNQITPTNTNYNKPNELFPPGVATNLDDDPLNANEEVRNDDDSELGRDNTENGEKDFDLEYEVEQQDHTPQTIMANQEDVEEENYDEQGGNAQEEAQNGQNDLRERSNGLVCFTCFRGPSRVEDLENSQGINIASGDELTSFNVLSEKRRNLRIHLFFLINQIQGFAFICSSSKVFGGALAGFTPVLLLDFGSFFSETAAKEKYAWITISFFLIYYLIVYVVYKRYVAWIVDILLSLLIIAIGAIGIYLIVMAFTCDLLVEPLVETNSTNCLMSSEDKYVNLFYGVVFVLMVLTSLIVPCYRCLRWINGYESLPRVYATRVNTNIQRGLISSLQILFYVIFASVIAALLFLWHENIRVATVIAFIIWLIVLPFLLTTDFGLSHSDPISDTGILPANFYREVFKTFPPIDAGFVILPVPFVFLFLLSFLIEKIALTSAMREAQEKGGELMSTMVWIMFAFLLWAFAVPYSVEQESKDKNPPSSEHICCYKRDSEIGRSIEWIGNCLGDQLSSHLQPRILDLLGRITNIVFLLLAIANDESSGELKSVFVFASILIYAPLLLGWLNYFARIGLGAYVAKNFSILFQINKETTQRRRNV